MINDNITQMIMEATKNREIEKASVYKLIKNEFLKHKTSKNASPLTELVEISIIQKMIKQREESVKIYKDAGREDLWVSEQKEIDILQTLIPKTPTEEDINNWISTNYNYPLEKNMMGMMMKKIKEDLPGVDGKLASQIISKMISK